jgi:TadE-like protein
MKANRDRERGATLVEAAISYGLLFLALFAVVEFGLTFKDWLSVSQATREGARAGATFGQDLSADILVLDGVEEALLPQGLASGDEVRIFRANNPQLSESQLYSYSPGFDCSDPTSIFPPGDCCNWSPCPEFGRTNYQVPGWNPQDRDVTAPITDRIGVSIEMTHEWVTNFIGTGSIDLSTTTDFQVEPQFFEAS